MRRVISFVVLSQFVSALSALGIPPFFSLILSRSFQSQIQNPARLAGVLFVVPALFSAVSSPFWGQLADRYGKKKLLLRAQIGLTISFLVAGFSTSLTQFVIALMLQGILGGTFTASRAYLADHLEDEQLAHGLTLMETAPRAALVLSPIIVGAFMGMNSPIEIYRYLAILPMISFLMTCRLPDHSSREAITPSMEQISTHEPFDISFYLILGIQFLFGLASTIPSPYFSDLIHDRFKTLSTEQIGMIFGLPHFIYLACAATLSHRVSKDRLLETLVAAFVLQSISLVGQALTHSLVSLVLWRLCMGVSMTISYICFHGIISRISQPKSAGGLFGWIDSSNKLSNVLGGLVASVGFGYLGSQSLLLMSAITFSCTAGLVLWQTWIISKERTA